MGQSLGFQDGIKTLNTLDFFHAKVHTIFSDRFPSLEIRKGDWASKSESHSLQFNGERSLVGSSEQARSELPLHSLAPPNDLPCPWIRLVHAWCLSASVAIFHRRAWMRLASVRKSVTPCIS